MEIIYHHFESVSSTNDWVKAHLKTLPSDSLLLVTADGQTAARGQYGRQWFSPKGVNIYASFGFLVGENQNPLQLTHLLAISTAHTLKKYGIFCQIKWPNDLLVNQKKIAGILCETESLSSQLGIALGIGLNVNMAKTTLAAINQPATSLLLETGQTYNIQKILTLLKEHFISDLACFFQKGFTPFTFLFQELIEK